MHKRVTHWILSLLFLILLSWLIPATTHADNHQLHSKYIELQSALENNAYGIPVYIISNGDDNTMLGEIYGIVHHPFQTVHAALGTPDNWCDIVPQHLNIKACTYQHLDGFCRLTFYTGRKFYEPADEVYQLSYKYVLTGNAHDYLQANLSAADGPMGTQDYQIIVEAIPLDESTSFIHFSYSYQYNFLTELGMNTYLAFLGRDKVGFSVLDQDEDGQPVYVQGIRGIIERNTIRYYLAIQSYLETIQIDADQRFAARIGKWFDLTEQHHQQLYEMDKPDYLQYKHLEHADQLRLQAAIDATIKHDKRCNP